MGHESKEVWTKRVERWRDSGLSAAEFAAELGVNANSLRHWGWRINAAQRESRAAVKIVATPKAEPLAFVEVVGPSAETTPVTTSTQAIELVLASGLVVRLPSRFEAEALRRLLAVVG